MPISFPSSPSVGQTSAQNGRTYTWSGYAWELASNVAGHAASHASGGGDPLSLSASQVSGLASVATSGSAADLTGTLADSRLSGNVVLTSDTRLASNGSKGDITVSSNGAAWAINANAVVTADIADSAVTDAKIASVAATKLTGTLDDARLSSNVPLLPGMLLKWSQPSGVVDVVAREDVTSNAIAMTSGTVLLTFFTPLISLTVTQIAAISGTTAGSGLTLARMGLFTVASDQSVTLVAKTASDTTLFTATNTTYTRSLDGSPASYSLVAGTRYAVGVITVGTTMPALVGKTGNAYAWATTPRISAQRTSQTDLASLTSLSVVGTYVFFRLS